MSNVYNNLFHRFFTHCFQFSQQSTISVDVDRTYSTTPNYMSLEDKDPNSDAQDVETDTMISSKMAFNTAENSRIAEISNSDSCDSFVTVEQSIRVDPILEAMDKVVEGEKPNPVKEEEYRRQRDPDAMIASLDRLTATLVQQTEAMRERDSGAMKQSLVSDVWADDSQNSITFPSISMSAPFVASFKSDFQDEHATMMPEILDEDETFSMTNSRIIEMEAQKLAEAMTAELDNNFFDLENINPPSMMGSLLSLTCSIGLEEESKSTKVPVPVVSRKRSLPVGMVAKRAVGNSQNSHASSLENLLNACNYSHLENQKPPSMMDELPDGADMENSMLSVASITSEIADSKGNDSLTSSDPVFDFIKPVANVLAITCMRFV